jgi:hypothetical protein
MRQLFLKDYILSSEGYIINRDGDILPNFIDEEGEVFFNVKNRHFYFADLLPDYQDPVFKNIKYLKQSKKWKTYVTTSAQKIEDNKSFDSEYEAAEYVNILYGKYGLDRVHNPVPKPFKGFYEEYLVPDCKDKYLVTSLGSIWIKATDSYRFLGEGKSTVYITNSEDQRKEFIVSDLVKLIKGD